MPEKIYLASDGPRINNKEDLDLIEDCYETIKSLITWKCNIKLFKQEVNYGCDIFVPKAINWFFSNVSYGVIIEDDCILTPQFFLLCEKLLPMYELNTRVMNISSSCIHPEISPEKDYYFSNYPTNWGWATWASSWKFFKPNVTDVEEYIHKKNGLIARVNNDRQQYKFWSRFFRGLSSGKYSYWDAKWVYSIWTNDGVSITPNINLVNNIGYGMDATHTKSIIKGMNNTYGVLGKNINHPPPILNTSSTKDKKIFMARYKPKIYHRVVILFRRLLKLERQV